MTQAVAILFSSLLTSFAVGAVFIAAAAKERNRVSGYQDPQQLLDALVQSRPLLFAFVVATLLIAAMMWFVAAPFA